MSKFRIPIVIYGCNAIIAYDIMDIVSFHYNQESMLLTVFASNGLRHEHLLCDGEEDVVDTLAMQLVGHTVIKRLKHGTEEERPATASE